MDPPQYGYEYWKHYHSDCELVHVLWTDYCGILHEKLVPADSFSKMYRKHAYNLSDSDDLLPLTVSAASLTSLPDGTSAADENYPSYETCEFLPDYSSIKPCVDSSRRATGFARVGFGIGSLGDPREILKGVCKGLGSSKEQKLQASLEFQFMLRSLSDGKVHLPKGDGPAQDILQKLAGFLRTHSHSATGPAVHSSDISDDGVLTIALHMSDDVLEAVDNYYRMKRALQSITSLEGLRASFFFASDDTSTGLMCKNKLRCRLHLKFGSGRTGPEACQFAAGIMEAEQNTRINPSIYAFVKPNWLTYTTMVVKLPLSRYKREYITWGVRNSKTTINFPEGRAVGRLEFGDIDCMANMYLVVATILILGTRSIENPAVLKDIPQAVDVNEYDPGTIRARHGEILRVPLSGPDSCRNIQSSARLRGTLIGQIEQVYPAVREQEEEVIVGAVHSGRVTSSWELLEKWY